MSTGGWAFAGELAVAGTDKVTLVEGSSFCVAGRAGDIEPGTTQGLFVLDTRVVSRWELRVDEQPVLPLATYRQAPYQAMFLGRARERARALLVCRERYVGAGMREDITLVNLSAEATRCELTLAVHGDFADLFDVKQGGVRERGEQEVRCEPGALTYGYARRSCRVETQPDAEVSPWLLRFRVELRGRERWTASVLVSATADGERLPVEFPLDRPVHTAAPVQRLAEWERRCAQVEADDVDLANTLRRTREDLGSLLIPGERDLPTVAAGVPWFMTLFGRDSLLTSYLALPLDPQLAVGTLRSLAAHQGREVNPRTEEEPGKILHEVRSAVDMERHYYGTADATPLFVVLLGELHRWGFAAPELLPHADRAMEWIERYGDRDGDGFVEYQRTADWGLVNQGWKDSSDGVNFADGRLAEPPIALAEVQGYVYAAYLARAELAAAHGDTATARTCAERAAALKRAFDERFWLPERGWYAVALDRDKRPVDALASNMGHCLWSGIVEPDKAELVADRLLSPEMFNGWGVRTLASTMGAYNPLSYHNGSVWPHDNALIADGLMRYGLVEHAQRIALGILHAAKAFDGRLPELFCGFGSDEYPAPVPYATSCSPQAWASATPVHLLRVLLRLDPDVPNGRLHVSPALPDGFGELSMRGVRVAGAEVGIRARDGQLSVEGLPPNVTAAPARQPPG